MSRAGAMELFELGERPWAETQWIYHALPRLGRPAVVVCWPDRPHLCLGFSQDLEHEVDLEFCARHRLPVFRRAVGGGLVYLDGRQVYFQVILPRAPGARPVGEVYRRCLRPVADVLGALGLEAELRAPADLVVRGRKISGNGGGEIAGHPVVVGNILLDFDFRRMAGALRAPHPLFRRLVRERMAARLTTLRRELGYRPARRIVGRLLAGAFEAAFGPLRPGRVDGSLRAEMARVAAEMASPDWPDHPPRSHEGRDVKIAEGCYVRYRSLEGVPLAAIWVEEEGRVREVSFVGEAAGARREAWRELARSLEGRALTPEGVTEALAAEAGRASRAAPAGAAALAAVG